MANSTSHQSTSLSSQLSPSTSCQNGRGTSVNNLDCFCRARASQLPYRRKCNCHLRGTLRPRTELNCPLCNSHDYGQPLYSQNSHAQCHLYRRMHITLRGRPHHCCRDGWTGTGCICKEFRQVFITRRPNKRRRPYLAAVKECHIL